jgi:hypothetical protein
VQQERGRVDVLQKTDHVRRQLLTLCVLLSDLGVSAVDWWPTISTAETLRTLSKTQRVSTTAILAR